MHVLANVLVLPVAGLTLSSVAALSALLGSVPRLRRRKRRGGHAHVVYARVGTRLALVRVVPFLVLHPHTLDACPCPPFHARLGEVCTPCPGT